MSTRIRAIVAATVSAVVVFVGLSGIIDFNQILLESGIENTVVQEFIVAGFVAVLMIFLTWWVLFFKQKGLSLFIIGTFPGMALFPFLLLFVSIINAIFNDLGQFAVAVIATMLYWLVAYLLVLTANVLNGAMLFNIPLGQAGKAAQFIFSLVSSYFLIAVLFGAAFPIEVRVIVIGAFVFYFSYSTIWTLKVPAQQVWLSSISITAIMVLATILLSIWPIGSVYATVTLVVLLYIPLNVALEMRERIGNMIWLEYSILLTLVVLILLTNGVWGINGPIL